MLFIVFLSSFVIVCWGKVAHSASWQRTVDSKNSAIRQIQWALGVDITQLQVVRRHGQFLQATNGWAYIKVHSFDDCSSADFLTFGLATGVCLANQPDSEGQVTTSYIYSCTDSKLLSQLPYECIAEYFYAVYVFLRKSELGLVFII